MVASRNATGTARPVTAELACGLMLIAIDGAINAMDTPTADQTVSRRASCGPAPVTPPPSRHRRPAPPRLSHFRLPHTGLRVDGVLADLPAPHVLGQDGLTQFEMVVRSQRRPVVDHWSARARSPWSPSASNRARRQGRRDRSPAAGCPGRRTGSGPRSTARDRASDTRCPERIKRIGDQFGGLPDGWVIAGL